MSRVSSFEEAVTFAIASLNAQQRADIAAMPSAMHARGVLHFNFGLWLRNVLDLHGDERLLQSIAEACPEACWFHVPGEIPIAEPDMASGVIVEEVWKRLRSQAVPGQQG